MEKTIKPNVVPFILFPLLKFFFSGALGVALIELWFLPGIIPIYLLMSVLFLASIVFFFWLYVRSQKERYILKDNRFILRTGGFFYDKERELIVKNITLVWLNLPFIERKIFSTGHVRVKAAGSQDVEVELKSVDVPSEVYEEISKIMQKNGFSLKTKDPVQKEIPNSVGIFLEVFSKLFTGLLVVAFLFLESYERIQEMELGSFIPLMVTLAVIAVFSRYVFKFLDLKNRVYYLYDTVLRYEDGFFTENYAFIPIANLANCELNQTFFEKLIDVYDIKISSQGSNNNFHFTNMIHAQRFMENLQGLISKNKKTHIKREEKSSAKTSVSKDDDAGFKHKKTTGFTKDLSMDAMRSIVWPAIITLIIGLSFFFGLVVLRSYVPDAAESGIGSVLMGGVTLIIVIIFTIFITILNAITVAATRFKVDKSSMKSLYSFITTKNVQFEIDKITCMTVRESIVDKVFGTMSIDFLSIGSSDYLTFKNIKKEKGLEEKIAKKLGIRGNKVLKKVNSEFTPGEMLKAWFYVTLPLAIISVATLALGFFMDIRFLIAPFAIVAIVLSVLGYKGIFYSTSKLTLFDDHSFFTRGIIIDKRDYTLYSNLKDMKSRKFPFCKKGSLGFNAAGEIAAKDEKGNTVSTYGYEYVIRFVKDPFELHDEIDQILLMNPMKSGKPSKKVAKKDLAITKDEKVPDYRNSLAIAIFVSIVFWPGVLAIPLVILYVKMMRYKVQDYRMMRVEGIFFRYKKTVVFNRIDHIEKSTGLLNKMFGNGNVVIYTTGSGTPELTISNVIEHKEFYEYLENKYHS